MKKHLQQNRPYFWIIAIILIASNFLFVTRLTGLSYGAFSWQNYAQSYAVELTNFTAYQSETYVYGYVDTANVSVILTLKDSGGTVKSQVNTVSDGYYFNAYFGDVIAGGDQIDVDLPNTPTVTVEVADLNGVIHKANDTITGTSPANQSITAWLYSNVEQQWYSAYLTADSNGNFTADFSAEIDIFTGDELDLQYYDANNYRTILRDIRAHGFTVYPNSSYRDSVSGYAEPGAEVNLTLKDSSGAVKAATTDDASSSGYFYTDFADPFPADIVVGDTIEVQYGTSPIQSIEVVDVTVDSIDTASDVVDGTAPSNSKVEVYTYDSYLATWGTRIVNAGAGGAYTANFSTAVAHQGRDVLAAEQTRPAEMGTEQDSVTAVPSSETPEPSREGAAWGAAAGLSAQSDQDLRPEEMTAPEDTTTPIDIMPGSYASATYHNAQDNEVFGSNLYAGPYLKAYVDTDNYNQLFVVGERNQVVQATLRNALGAIKGTTAGSTGDNASGWLTFNDSAGATVEPTGGDEIEIVFSGGPTLTLDVASIDFVSDRDARTVYGNVPPNQAVRVIANWGDDVGNTTADSSGHFSYTFSDRLTGGYGVDVYVRDGAGYDTIREGYTPQFTVNTTWDRLNGYGPSETAVVATLLDDTGTPKETKSTTTSNWGSYYLYFSTDINTGDRVVVDVGPLHYEQEVIPLSIAADTDNGIVYGDTVPNGWLNVFARTYFGPYSQSNYKYFSADNSGSYAVAFPEVHGGDHLEVIYWEDGYKDRVSVVRRAPALYINHVSDTVSGYAGLGETGAVTIRDDNGSVKASALVTASDSSGYFSYTPENVDVAPGDQVDVSFSSLTQSSDVIPMSGTLDTASDAVTGTSLSNEQIGVQAYHWSGSYYSSYVNGNSLQGFADADASGDFSFDFSAAADLETGDYAQIFYRDENDTHYNAYLYTTDPTITVTDYPTAVQPNNPVDVTVTLADGAHSQNLYLRWDVESHADDNAYRYSSTRQQGAIGQNLASFIAPSGGTVYFKARAYVDGRTIWSDEYTVEVDDTSITTLYDPVSGTTNDTTPTVHGITGPGAVVTLYKDDASFMTTTADSLGYFSFDITSALASGTHAFYAIATVNGVDGPQSNTVHLTVDPTLSVDPVHILITTDIGTQHLRDDSGYANLGGQIWTRSGETVEVSIPISYTSVYSADLYIGGVFATNLLNSGADVYVGTYQPPTSGAYQLDLKFRSGGSTGPVETVNILTGLIDPDGYVYNAGLGEDYRVAGAEVTCYQLVDETTDSWQVWNAAVWDQVNPQTVGADGYYAFFTLPGKYKVVVTAPGYWDYESPVLTVVDEPVHHNVPLQIVRRSYLPLVTQP